jgi:hypothetical protein
VIYFEEELSQSLGTFGLGDTLNHLLALLGYYIRKPSAYRPMLDLDTLLYLINNVRKYAPTTRYGLSDFRLHILLKYSLSKNR